jgi:hypothetical protein
MAKNNQLTGDAAKQGVGLHRIPNPVEILQYRLGMPLLRANELVKHMTDEDKSYLVEHRDSTDDAEVKTKIDAIFVKSSEAFRKAANEDKTGTNILNAVRESHKSQAVRIEAAKGAKSTK